MRWYDPNKWWQDASRANRSRSKSAHMIIDQDAMRLAAIKAPRSSRGRLSIGANGLSKRGALVAGSASTSSND